MPKTDVVDDRAYQRLQGIDFREHADQNVAHDCLNLRLNSASRMVNFAAPTKIKDGSFIFACESKSPALEEFDLDLSDYESAPEITYIVSGDDGTSVKVGGVGLKNCTAVLYDDDGHCLESGLDFSISVSGSNLIIDIYPAEFTKFSRLALFNVYGAASAKAELTGLNNVLFFGSEEAPLFKMGIDPSTLEFTIWAKQGGRWNVVWSKSDSSAKKWIEDIDREVYVDYFNLSASEAQKWVFVPEGSTDAWLNLKFMTGSNVEAIAQGESFTGFGPASGSAAAPSEYHETLTEYAFGKFGTYRLYAPYGEHKLLLQMKSDSTTNVYDLTLQAWEITE